MVRFPRRQFLRFAAGAAALPAVSRIASAQSYPSQLVTVIVPSGAGGPTDVVARIVTEHMRGTLGHALVIENVPAANGTLGIGRVSRAKPDGYTIAFSVSSSTHVFNAAIYALPYDVVNDFEPIGLVTKDRGALIVARKSMAANDLRELIAWMRANPGKATLGHTGPGSPAHIAFIVFQKLTGARLQDVAYRSAGQAMQHVIAGHIDMMMASPSIGLPAVQAGSVKAYVVTAENRLVAAPDIPTVDEAGLPGFYAAGWFGLWAPRGTPRDIISRLNAALVDALADTVVRARLDDLGQEIFPRGQQTPEALAALQKAEIEKWWPLIKQLHKLKVE